MAINNIEEFFAAVKDDNNYTAVRNHLRNKISRIWKRHQKNQVRSSKPDKTVAQFYEKTVPLIEKFLYIRNEYGETVLHLAAKNNASKIVELLLQIDTEIHGGIWPGAGEGKVLHTITDNGWHTPLMKAAEYGNLECLDTLLNANSRFKEAAGPYNNYYVEWSNNMGRNALALAKLEGGSKAEAMIQKWVAQQAQGLTPQVQVETKGEPTRVLRLTAYQRSQTSFPPPASLSHPMEIEGNKVDCSIAALKVT